MRKSIFTLLAFTTSCGVSTPGAPNPTLDMTAPPAVSYCGGKGKHYAHLSDCVDRCVPDEQVFFFCTELRGKIAYTRQFLTIRQDFGYSLEFTAGSQKCGDVATALWSLVPLQGLTNANVGRMSASSVENDCSKLPKQAAYIEMNLDRLYYIPIGPLSN